MLKSNKHVFWEALLVSITIFIVGLFLGMLIETSNSNKISQLYTQSEISLSDAKTATSLLQTTQIDCDEKIKFYTSLADEIYKEARQLELYEDSGKITDTMKLLHKKYDLLRTILWGSSQQHLKDCDDYNTIAYLYLYNTENINTKATQNVWSKLLSELKENRPNTMLIPIASDQNLTSLDVLTTQYDITQYPAIIINNDQILYQIDNITTLQSVLD